MLAMPQVAKNEFFHVYSPLSHRFCMDIVLWIPLLFTRKPRFIAALEFSTALAQVDSVQQKLTANLSSSAGMLKQTQNMFDKNAEKVAQNLKEMDERLKKLGK